MTAKPPLLPVLIGIGSIGVGLFNGSLFTIWTANLLLAPPELGLPPVLSVLPGLLGLMGLLSLLQIPAGLGILLHRRWGRQLAEGMALGATVTGGLGMLPGLMGLIGHPDIISTLFVWGFLSGLAWAIALKVAARFRSMKAAFGATAALVVDNKPPEHPIGPALNRDSLKSIGTGPRRDRP